MSFGDIDRHYQALSCASLYISYVAPGPVTALGRARTALNDQLDRGNDDLDDLVQALYFAQFRLATSPLPPSHKVLGLNETLRLLTSEAGQFQTGSITSQALSLAQAAVASLLSASQSPLGEHTRQMLELLPEAERALVIRRTTDVLDVERWLDEVGVPSPVLSRTQLRKATVPPALVCVGSPNLFTDGLWNAPRSESTCWVTYPFGSNRLPKGGLFDDEGTLTTPSWRVAGTEHTVRDVQPINADESLLRSVLKQRQQVRKPSDGVPALLLLLEGGNAVWTSATPGAFMWTVSIDEEGAPSVGRVDTKAITPDTYVLFRAQGAGKSIIRTYADSVLNAKPHRWAQDHWKSGLRSAVERHGGVHQTEQTLRSLGAETVGVARWLDESSIRPQRRQDFDAVCDLADLTRPDETWEALGKLRRLHTKAGHRLRAALSEALFSKGVADLIEDGIQTVELEGIGSLSAYRVIYRHDGTELVDPDLIDEPFIAEERGWPE